MASTSAQSSVNDSCRFCLKNLRIRGVIAHSVQIFDRSRTDKPIYERIADLGLVLLNEGNRSKRICIPCVNVIARLERDQSTFRTWQQQEHVTKDEPSTLPSSAASVTSQCGTPNETPRAANRMCHEHPPQTTARGSISQSSSADSTPKPSWVSKRTVSTQLSTGTLREHYRSKSVQATVTTNSRGTVTERPLLLFSSTPVNIPSPPEGSESAAKRPRLEIKKEEEEDFSIPLHHDSTYDPRESATHVSGQIQTDSDYEDVKYIVFESCLRELFETCPICKHHCIVQRQRCGTFVAFSQDCPRCSYNRKWQSQHLKGSTPAGNLQLSAELHWGIFCTDGNDLHNHESASV